MILALFTEPGLILKIQILIVLTALSTAFDFQLILIERWTIGPCLMYICMNWMIVLNPLAFHYTLCSIYHVCFPE